jgi:uncharacterized protein YxjI
MRYILKQKFWSVGGEFTIKDEAQQDCYRVEGRVFAWGDKLTISDAQGVEEAAISQKLLSLQPTYEIFRKGSKFAEVTKEFSWWKKKFTLDVPGPNDYAIEGSFWVREYTFTRGGREVARVSKKLLALTDTYTVDIVDGEDDVAILATCVVIDLVCDDEQSRQL